MNEQKFYEVLEHHGLDEHVMGIYDDYNGASTDSRVIVISGYGLGDREKAFFRWIDKICYEHDEYEWTYDDQTTIDYDDGTAYADTYGERDYIIDECEIMGRRRFESGDLSFDDIAEDFINNPEKALPSWLDPSDGWEQKSCDFEDGWYGRNDSPDEILKQIADNGVSVVFQIDFVQPFATGFCVWTKVGD